MTITRMKKWDRREQKQRHKWDENENDITQFRVIASLMNIFTDPSIKKDAKFFDALQDVFKNNEKSDVFKPYVEKRKSSLYET